MAAIEQWGIIVLALAVIAGLYGLRWRARRRRRPLSLGTVFPDDGRPGAQQRPPPRRWVGYIGTGDWWSRKYWVCPHDHPSGDEALACARDWLRNGKWDGKTWTW
jgi:hypothetical protein